MTDRRQPMSDDQLDVLLIAAGDRIDYPAMTDPAAAARARIDQRATAAQQPGTPDNVIPLPGRETTPIPPPVPPEPEQLGREQTSRLREFALLGGGLAAATIVALVLTLVFRGFDDASEDEPGPSLAGSPLAAEPYEIPGYEFVATAGQPQVPNEPVDVAIGPDGTHYVLDLGLQRIVAFTEDGEVDTDWGDEGFSGRIPRTFGAAIGVGPDGGVYVAAEQVLVFDANGEQVDAWPFPDNAGDRASDPRAHGLVVDSEGNVYVAGRGAIWRFEAGAGAATTIELESESDLQIQIDGQDHLYAASRAGSIYRLSDGGGLELIGRTSGQEDINGLAVAPDGSFVIFRSSHGSDEPSTFIIFDSDGSEIASWPIERVGSWIGTFSPLWIGIEVQPDGTIVLPDPQGHRVSFYNPDGTLVSEIHDERPEAFGRLWRISVDGEGNILGYDPSEDPRVLRFAPDGELLREMPFEAELLGAMESLFQTSGFVATEDGGFVIAHQRLNHVSIYSPEGELEQQWGQMMGVQGESEGLLFPLAITLDDEGLLYLIDQASDDNLRRYTLDGEFVNDIGHYPAQRVDLAYNAGFVWAAVEGRIVRFPAEGGEPETIAASNFGEEAGDLPGFPITLAFDPEGNILTYILSSNEGDDSFPGLLAKLDPQGNIIWTSELEPDAFDRYVDLAIAPDGTLYISDSHLRQILVYRPTDEAQLPELTVTAESVPLDNPSNLLVVERTADNDGLPQFGIYDPANGLLVDLPPGELAGISPDGGMLLMIDREPGEERLRLDLIAVSTETFEELWRTDVGERAESRPNTIYLDTAIARDTAYVAIHDPDFRGEMLEIARVRLSDGFMQWYSAIGLDTDVSELTDPSVEVALLPSPPGGAPEVTSFIRAPEENRTTTQSVLGPGYDHRLRESVPLQPGDRYLLPGGEGLFNVPHSGYSTDPAIEYVMFDDLTVGEIALPFAALADSSGSFTEYAVANDGRTLYALSLNSSQVAIVDLERLEVEQIVDLGDVPIHSLTGDMEWTTLTPFYANHPITFSPDGRYIYCLGYPRDHADAFTFTPPIWKIDTTNWEIVDDWTPEAPWLAKAVHSSDDGSQLYVSLGMLAEVDDPDAQFRLTTENLGFAVLSTDALDDQTGYVDLQGYQLVGTLADVYRETYGISPG